MVTRQSLSPSIFPAPSRSGLYSFPFDLSRFLWPIFFPIFFFHLRENSFTEKGLAGCIEKTVIHALHFFVFT
jgi:hypothetical protein